MAQFVKQKPCVCIVMLLMAIAIEIKANPPEVANNPSNSKAQLGGISTTRA